MSPDEEENAVRQIGDLIGYSRLIQLAERLRGQRPTLAEYCYAHQGPVNLEDGICPICRPPSAEFRSTK